MHSDDLSYNLGRMSQFLRPTDQSRASMALTTVPSGKSDSYGLTDAATVIDETTNESHADLIPTSPRLCLTSVGFENERKSDPFCSGLTIDFCISIAVMLGNSVSYSKFSFFIFLSGLSMFHFFGVQRSAQGHELGSRQYQAPAPWT